MSRQHTDDATSSSLPDWRKIVVEQNRLAGLRSLILDGFIPTKLAPDQLTWVIHLLSSRFYFEAMQFQTPAFQGTGAELLERFSVRSDADYQQFITTLFPDEAGSVLLAQSAATGTAPLSGARRTAVVRAELQPLSDEDDRVQVQYGLSLPDDDKPNGLEIGIRALQGGADAQQDDATDLLPQALDRIWAAYEHDLTPDQQAVLDARYVHGITEAELLAQLDMRIDVPRIRSAALVKLAEAARSPVVVAASVEELPNTVELQRTRVAALYAKYKIDLDSHARAVVHHLLNCDSVYEIARQTGRDVEMIPRTYLMAVQQLQQYHDRERRAAAQDPAQAIETVAQWRQRAQAAALETARLGVLVDASSGTFTLHPDLRQRAEALLSDLPDGDLRNRIEQLLTGYTLEADRRHTAIEGHAWQDIVQRNFESSLYKLLLIDIERQRLEACRAILTPDEIAVFELIYIQQTSPQAPLPAHLLQSPPTTARGKAVPTVYPRPFLDEIEAKLKHHPMPDGLE